MVLPGKANVFHLGNWMPRPQRETNEQEGDISDTDYCSNHLTLHGQDDGAWKYYEEENQEHFMRGEYAEELVPGSLITTEEFLLTPGLSNADLIFWGLKEGSMGMGHLQMSFSMPPQSYMALTRGLIHTHMTGNSLTA
jgi:hypothetical protein